MSRYIDVENFSQMIYENFGRDGEFDYRDLIRILREQPTTDVKEVVRGEWVKPYVLFSDRICSCCGYKTTVGCIKNFCTNCGADMRNTK